MSSQVLLCVKLSAYATVPTRITAESAGFDMHAAHNAVVPAGEHALVRTDIAFSPPRNTYVRLASRSGLTATYNIHVAAGVIDHDYRGNVTALLQNFSNVEFRVTIGDRICQAILEKVNMADILIRQELPGSPRNNSGFGSSGIKRFRKDEDDGLGGDGGGGSGGIVHSSLAVN